MKKVLFFIHDLGIGGAEKVLVNLVNNMDKSCFDITVQSLFGGGVNEQFLNTNIKYRVCFKKSFPGNSHYLKLFKPETLYKRFVKEHYDIVVSFLEGSCARIVSGCNDNNTKTVSWIHCKINDYRTAAIGFRSFSEAKRCYFHFDNTVCVSKWVKNYFTELFNFNKPIEVLYNTNESSQIIKRSNEEIHEAVFSRGVVNICSSGKIAKVKAFDRLARIHKRLISEGINNRVYIMGIGSEKKAIENYLSDNGLTKSFIFLGYQMNPYKFIRKCDLYVCSSLSEGFSTSVTESLIVGTPVVTTLCSGMQELLGENNEYGIITENNEDSLYEGIKKMIVTPGLLEYYSDRAKERGKDFSTEKTVKAVEEMLNNI